MGVNPPDPTADESYDTNVADARNTVMEWLGNCYPVQSIAAAFVDQSPLALGYFVVAALHGVREGDFTPVHLATMRGEVQRDRVAKGYLSLVEAAVDSRMDPETLVLSGSHPDNNTAPYRQHVADAIARRDLLRIDWHKLAEDMSDEPPTWKGYTEDHDTRGCVACTGAGCMVGYEDVLAEDAEEATNASEAEPDMEAIERAEAFRSGRSD